MVELKAGARLRSTVWRTEVIVIRPATSAISLECGGAPMIASADEADGSATIDATHAGGTLLGKRYVHDDSELEVLCTKAGEGSLSVDGTSLPLKDAKALPSSD